VSNFIQTPSVNERILPGSGVILEQLGIADIAAQCIHAPVAAHIHHGWSIMHLPAYRETE
jgi:hypothetical protein